MTRCTVFESNETTPKPLKKIEFVNYFNGDSICPATFSPKSWDNIQRIGRVAGMEIMHAWDNGRSERGCVYSGHWNDGVV